MQEASAQYFQLLQREDLMLNQTLGRSWKIFQFFEFRKIFLGKVAKKSMLKDLLGEEVEMVIMMFADSAGFVDVAAGYDW